MPGKIKVLHLITGLGIGGAESMLYKTVLGMDRSAFENIIVVLKQNGATGEKLKNEGIPVYSLNLDKHFFPAAGMFSLYRLLKLHKPDIMQTWMYHADLCGLIVGKWAGVPNILWNIRCSRMDGDLTKKMTKVVIKICSLLSSKPAKIITNS